MDATLEQLRPLAFQIAYRMLGSVAEAEDVVQEALLRVHGVLEAGEQIESPQAYLSTVVTRLGIDRLRSAQLRRETYVGEWLPEPVVTGDRGAASDPAAHAEMSDTLSLAFLVLLERLSPEQRAVFLLREVFDYDYGSIAEIVGKSEVACRQLAARARREVAGERRRFEASGVAQRELADRFLAAAQSGDLAALEEMLAADVTLHADGGGKVQAAARPIVGRRRVARAVLRYVGSTADLDDLVVERVEVNGAPGAIGYRGSDVLFVVSLDVLDGQIQGIRSIANPDKLAHLRGRPSDVRPVEPAVRDR